MILFAASTSASAASLAGSSYYNRNVCHLRLGVRMMSARARNGKQTKAPRMCDSGFLILDKPRGMTSRAAVDHAGRWFPRGARLGHTGTLDPLATGALVIAVGAATRLVDYVQRMEKAYRAGIRLGARSDTDDEEGTITHRHVDVLPERT